ncbi:MAG: hypothetical protein U5L96_10375 [Owenweeksia sp.]|nr:hypothetical protein [Owenweeksia sp.]
MTPVGYGRYMAGNRLCAGIFVVTTGGRHTLLFTALTAEGKEWGAMPYLINEYLIFQSGKARWFDFEGSNLPGLARF